MTNYGPLATSPAGVVQATTETIPWTVNMTAYLESLPLGGAVSDAASTLVDIRTGTSVTLEDDPTVSGNIVTQIVRGSALTANHTYTLTISFTAAENTVLSTFTTISVPA